jgi:hypothetical protein
VKLDLTITLGNVIQSAVLVTAVYAAYSKIRERLIRIETQLDPLWKDYTDRRHVRRRTEDRA